MPTAGRVALSLLCLTLGPVATFANEAAHPMGTLATTCNTAACPPVDASMERPAGDEAGLLQTKGLKDLGDVASANQASESQLRLDDGRGAGHGVQRESEGARMQGELGTVKEVYTYGAPATADPPLENMASADRCFPGLRSYTEDDTHGSKKVDAAAMINFMPHAKTPTVALRWATDSLYVPCPGKPEWPQRGALVFENWGLHYENHYVPRLEHVTVEGQDYSQKEPFVMAQRFVILAFKSYDSTANTKTAIAKKLPGWKLVAKEISHGALDDKDPVMIVQDTNTLDCALVFTGTNYGGELGSSIVSHGTGYCGFDNVHAGYRNELWTITGDLWPSLGPKLSKCSAVTCVGHSLGGALCELFAACVNSKRADDADFQRLKWTQEAPEQMPEI